MARMGMSQQEQPPGERAGVCQPHRPVSVRGPIGTNVCVLVYELVVLSGGSVSEFMDRICSEMSARPQGS